jgi:hypothetical protein
MMTFAFWTFFKNIKMSIFGFLEIIFFCRTEKSGTQTDVFRRTENGKENTILFLFEKCFLGFFSRSGFHWKIFWLHFGYI